jgi:hypoxanthine phosphoribosyltransferase
MPAMPTRPATPRKLVQRIPANRILHVTYDKVFQVVKQFEPALAAERFDLILGVARSGVVPATMISQVIAVPVAFIQCSRVEAKPHFLTPVDVRGRKVLVVEDIIGLGLTIGRVLDFVQSLGARTKSFCLYYDEQTSQVRPDYGIATRTYVHAQWDRTLTSPASRRALRDKNGRTTDADATECLGLDLDFAFANRRLDVPALRAQLRSILAFTRYAGADPLLALTGAITSARDLDRQQQRLAQHGITNVVLVRGGKTPGARAQAIIRYGISKYFDPDLERATLISARAPCTDIYWWRGRDRLRIYTNRIA